MQTKGQSNATNADSSPLSSNIGSDECQVSMDVVFASTKLTRCSFQIDIRTVYDDSLNESKTIDVPTSFKFVAYSVLPSNDDNNDGFLHMNRLERMREWRRKG